MEKNSLKIDRLETHDRYKHFIKNQWDVVTEGVNECLNKNPLSLAIQDKSPYVYLYGHFRTHEDGVSRRLIWQPRLEKPKPEANSFLFRAKSKSDEIEICWVLPACEMWSQYKKGTIIENCDIIQWSINQFTNHIRELSRPFPDDYKKDQVKRILLEIARDFESQAQQRKIKQEPLVASLA